MDSDFKNPREWQANVREWLEVVEEHLSQIHAALVCKPPSIARQRAAVGLNQFIGGFSEWDDWVENLRLWFPAVRDVEILLGSEQWEAFTTAITALVKFHFQSHPVLLQLNAPPLQHALEVYLALRGKCEMLGQAHGPRDGSFVWEDRPVELPKTLYRLAEAIWSLAVWDGDRGKAAAREVASRVWGDAEKESTALPSAISRLNDHLCKARVPVTFCKAGDFVAVTIQR